MTGDVLHAVYRVDAAPEHLDSRVDALLLEQTVEVPRAALTHASARALVGRVVEVEPDGRGFRVTLAQPVAATAADPCQLLNVLFGNSSLQTDVELLDLRVPDGLALELGGPRFGLEGVRALTGVEGRALTCSPLKPLGLSASELAELCHTFALAGLDVIKDDHGLADHPFCPFAERVRACLQAVDAAAQTTGRRALYVPNLIGTPRAVAEQARVARELGAEAVMVAPMLVGLPFLNQLARHELDVPVFAHPSLGGAQRIAPRALLGRLFPLYGADAVVFTSFGGRFGYEREVCVDLVEALRRPEAPIRAALPVAGGGIDAERVDEALAAYGADVVVLVLVGGSLLVAGPHLAERARRLVERVRQYPYES